VGGSYKIECRPRRGFWPVFVFTKGHGRENPPAVGCGLVGATIRPRRFRMQLEPGSLCSSGPRLAGTAIRGPGRWCHRASLGPYSTGGDAGNCGASRKAFESLLLQVLARPVPRRPRGHLHLEDTAQRGGFASFAIIDYRTAAALAARPGGRRRFVSIPRAEALIRVAPPCCRLVHNSRIRLTLRK